MTETATDRARHRSRRRVPGPLPVTGPPDSMVVASERCYSAASREAGLRPEGGAGSCQLFRGLVDWW